MSYPARHRLVRLLALLVFMSVHAGVAAPIDFNRDIQPILSENCYHCHGPDAKAREAKLRLDTKEGAFRTVDGVTPIKPGDSANSDVIVRILSTDKDDVMPPPKSNRALTAEQKQLLKRWVEEGAPWGEHWAFVAPKRPKVPDISDFGFQVSDLEKRDPARAAEWRARLSELAKWPRNPIDNFVLGKLLSEGLAPSPEAPPEKLLRRLSFDLTGLPPTPAELDAFSEASHASDESHSPYENTTTRLLASPRYGERMVWEWLDAARYADTNGYQGDPTRAMWHWRDWAIKALNDNMPFDQFTVQQLAGDLLPNPTTDQLVATGFHRNHMINGEGGRIAEESRVDYVMDRAETTGTVWMGLTLNCCRCHDHKFDPLTQREYYQLSAYFNSIDESGANDDRGYAKPVISMASPEQEQTMKEMREAEAAAKKDRDELEKKLQSEQVAWEEAVKGDGAKLAEVEWQILKSEEATSENGAKLTANPDGTVLVSGVNPDTDDLIVTALTQISGATAVKLEVLTDEALPQKGPGRAENGSWVLTEFKFLGDGKPTGLAAVRADFEQPGWPLKNALDGRDDTGWGAWPQVGKPHEAVFELLNDFGYRPDKMLSFRLQFRSSYKQHVIGKFRLSITNSPKVLLRPVPDEVKAALAVGRDQRTDAQKKAITDFYLASDPRLIAARKKADDTKAAREKAEREAPRTMVMRDRPQPRDTFILVKGAYDKFADKVEHGTPAVLPPLAAEAPKNRLALAQWLVSPDHPLTARVTVNRVWQMFFGRGLVKTTEDFGVQGEKPTHPELLDWLAREFIESGWDMKRLHRLIVTSATYRQSSRVPPGMAERDPENKLLARGARFRLSSWMLRDQALAAAGLLVEKLGGPPVKTYQPAGVWEDATFGQIKFTQDHGEALYRRSLYIFWRRIVGPTVFFDVANRQQCAVKTGRTNTPLHALVTMNDVTYVEAARALAERMLNQGGANDAERLAYGFRLCTARTPSAKEAAVLAGSLARFRQQYASAQEAAEKLIHTGESKPDTNLPASELAAHTSLALLLLNLDETLTKE
jgi:hypothetical protein